MRSSKSRSRGKNRNNRPSGGNVVNRVFDSSGPEGKVRGTPQQIIDKYNQLTRDAQLAGDRVAAENFAQHAEHYLRMLSEAQREIDKVREEQEEQNRQRQADRDRERAARMKSHEDSSNGDSGHDAMADHGLVDTPENRGDAGEPPRADTRSETRKPRRSTPQPAAPEAAEAEQKPRRSRRPRKAADEGEAAGDDGDTSRAATG